MSEMNLRKQNIGAYLFILIVLFSCSDKEAGLKYDSMGEIMVRIAELEIEPEFLEEYLNILKEESEASVRLERGVICIYPMYQRENPTEIKLLEIYANKEAYESHLQTPHFKHYKTTTLPMVKTLRLVDMKAIDPESMPMLFAKMGP